jgi:hypothetical protein
MSWCGAPPYLDCSSRGDKRFSADHARILGQDRATIAELYESAKRYRPGHPLVDTQGAPIDWRKIRGIRPVNLFEVKSLYRSLWESYFEERPDLVEILCRSSGLCDTLTPKWQITPIFVLWDIRKKLLLAEEVLT